MNTDSHTPEYIALWVIGADRAQWQPAAEMHHHEGLRRLAPSDMAAALPPRWRAALRNLTRGLGVGAVMHNKLWLAGLIEYRRGGRYRQAKLTPYARGVARALGACPHEQVARGPDFEKTYFDGQRERLGCEVCAECGSRRLVRRRIGRDLWYPAALLAERGGLGTPDTWRELPDHEPIGPYL